MNILKIRLTIDKSDEAPNIQEATASNTIQVSSAILQDQVTCFIINFTNLIYTNFYLDYKNMEL